MRMLHLLLILPLAFVAAVRADESPLPKLAMTPVFEALRFERPVYLTHIPDGSNRLLVVEQSGRVFIFDNAPDVSEAHVAIDLRSKVLSPAAEGGQNEEGLFGIAFHPKYRENRQVFLHYTAQGRRRNVLSRFTMKEDGRTIDRDSEQVLLELPQPYWNHNGGMIEFGPDGYLYIALGDGGSGGDPHRHGQNLRTLFATILRIDVDKPGADGKPYAIPQDNPFVNRPNARPEIYAYGLRNVWRFSFDRKTGDLYAGDVGQELWEEINLVTRGGNYGWNIREGAHAYRTPERGEPDGLIGPIVEHNHSESKSITGGYVYRGKNIPQLDGWYIYGDYATGLMWALQYNPQTKERQGPHVIGFTPEIASFGEDEQGEIYVVSLQGSIRKVTVE